MKNRMKRFVLIDASAVVHRAFFALPPLSTPEGRPVNAVYGFCLTLLKVFENYKPDYLAVAFDSRPPTFRHKIFQEYKSKRIKKGEELYSQFPVIKKVLEAFNIPIFEVDGYEADDVIATCVARLKKLNKKEENLETLIITGDMDTLLLVDDNVKVYSMSRGLSDIVVYDKEKIKKRYGLLPEQLIDFKALAGDSSDNIPGAKGIGEKWASWLVKKYNNLEVIYQNIDLLPQKIALLLEKNKKLVFLSRELVKPADNLEIDFSLSGCRLRGYDGKIIYHLFRQLGFKSLISRLGLEKGQPEVDDSKTTEAERIDQRLETILREMEQRGVLIDRDYLNKLAQKTADSLCQLKSQIFSSVGGEFNLDSPQQLSRILFVRIGLSPKGVKKTKTGISTAASELLKLKGSHPAIELILKYRELAKLKNTYLDKLPKLVDQENRIHTTYAQDTQTGRLSSKNPNLQNIPAKTEWGKMIRQGFIAPEGYVLLSADYSQIELRILAHLSQDKRLVGAFKKGLDIHKAVSEGLGVSRRTAKAINYGIIYGMSPYGLAETLGITHQQAQRYINEFFALYPGVQNFILWCIKEAQTKGYLETILGRRRYLPEINSPHLATRLSAERMAINFPCQGSAADILKKAMIEVNPKIANCQGRMILTVHDELVFEIPQEKINQSARLVKGIMENVVSLRVPLLVELTQGKNWGEMEEINIKS